MEGLESTKNPRETAGGQVKRVPEKKKVYIPPKAVVFHPDREQSEKLKGALQEVSDSIALSSIAKVLLE